MFHDNVVIGDRDDFMFVAMYDGIITLKVHLGTGTFETDVKSKDGRLRYDDDRWHRVVIRREVREVNTVLQ